MIKASRMDFMISSKAKKGISFLPCRPGKGKQKLFFIRARSVSDGRRQPVVTPSLTLRALISFTLATQQISFPPASQDEGWLEALVDLGAQVADINIDHVGGVFVLLVVKVFPDHGAGDHLALVEGQKLDEGELAR